MYTVERKQVPSGDGKDSLYTHSTGERKDSLCTVPSGEGKDSLCTVSKCIYPRSIFQTTQSRTGSRPGRGQTQAFSTRVAKAKNSPVNPVPDPGRIQATIQGTSKTIQVSLHQQRLRRLRQTKCLVDLYSRPAAERRYRSRAYQKQSRVLQPTVPGPKTRQPLEASHRPQLSKQIPGHTQIPRWKPQSQYVRPSGKENGLHP